MGELGFPKTIAVLKDWLESGHYHTGDSEMAEFAQNRVVKLTSSDTGDKGKAFKVFQEAHDNGQMSAELRNSIIVELAALQIKPDKEGTALPPPQPSV